MDEIVLRACRVDQRFDKQLGDDRNTYLSFALDSLASKDELLGELWKDLPRSRRSRNQEQLLAIAATYASRGNQIAAEALERICVRNHRAGHDKSLEWLIRGVGKKGLDYVLDNWTPNSPDRLSMWLYYAAEETLGKRRVTRILKLRKTPAARALWEVLHPEPEPPVLEVGATPLERVQSSIAEGKLPKFSAIRDLSPLDLQTLAASPPSQGGEVLRSWLWVFGKRPFPGDPVVLERYAKHGQLYVRSVALHALAQLTGDIPRRVALKYWSHPQLGGPAIGILGNNFVPGDEELILRCLTKPRIDWWFESVTCSLGFIFDRNEVPNEADIRRYVYERTPCTECRHYALHRMMEMGIASEEALREAQFDADGSTREMAERALASKV